MFAHGHKSHVVLTGPSGWGKSQLLEVSRDILRSQGVPCESTTAIAWSQHQGGGDRREALVLEDVQDVLIHSRLRHQFRQGLERRVRTGRRTLLSITDARPASIANALLPAARSWVVGTVAEPSPEERALVVRQIAASLNVAMGRSVERLLARHVHGNGHSLIGAIQRLKLVKPDWSDTMDVAQACGVLAPYLMGQDGWDPRDKVFEAVSSTWSSNFTNLGVTPVDVCCHLMLCDLGLSEREVSAFLAVTPSEAYGRSRLVSSAMQDPAISRAVAACRSAVLLGFEDA
ncbi:MAG: hypothetical protein KIT11_04780 [Fimbriimonadaceae bacterium]|nr:hypothetical protein [Fimbriimonadaceae bacterium]QYK56791.1 MAG: hypothetical protein KF733_04740 [Fimbriimonadaceae bacterium]